MPVSMYTNVRCIADALVIMFYYYHTKTQNQHLHTTRWPINERNTVSVFHADCHNYLNKRALKCPNLRSAPFSCAVWPEESVLCVHVLSGASDGANCSLQSWTVRYNTFPFLTKLLYDFKGPGINHYSFLISRQEQLEHFSFVFNYR